MTSETKLTSTAFYFSMIFYLIRRNYIEIFDANVITIATYLLIATSSLAIFVYVNQFKLFYYQSMGLLAFSTTYLGIVMAGTSGLGNSSHQVVEGLTRISLALFAIWHVAAYTRNLKLTIDPFTEPRSSFKNIWYGILYPPREFIRLVKILIYVVWIFYLITSGLDMLKTAQVDGSFFAQTEKISLNILFFGIQVPLMMASRASVSKTFSEYLKNLDWMQSSLSLSEGRQSRYQQIVHSTDISYDSINSQGKHLWIIVLMTIVLQAMEKQLIQLNLISTNWVNDLTNWITYLWNFVS